MTLVSFCGGVSATPPGCVHTTPRGCVHATSGGGTSTTSGVTCGFTAPEPEIGVKTGAEIGPADPRFSPRIRGLPQPGFRPRFSPRSHARRRHGFCGPGGEPEAVRHVEREYPERAAACCADRHHREEQDHASRLLPPDPRRCLAVRDDGGPRQGVPRRGRALEQGTREAGRARLRRRCPRSRGSFTSSFTPSALPTGEGQDDPQNSCPGLSVRAP